MLLQLYSIVIVILLQLYSIVIDYIIAIEEFKFSYQEF